MRVLYRDFLLQSRSYSSEFGKGVVEEKYRPYDYPLTLYFCQNCYKKQILIKLLIKNILQLLNKVFLEKFRMLVVLTSMIILDGIYLIIIKVLYKYGFMASVQLHSLYNSIEEYH